MRLLPALLLAASLAAPGVVRAASLSAVPTRVHAGERISVRWSSLPVQAREVELEVLVAGRWVRVSPELEAELGAFEWRVPEIAEDRAILRLRAGGDGWERELARSETFAILASPRGPAPSADERAEWWTALAAHAVSSPLAVLPGGPRLEARRAAPPADAPSPVQRLTPPREASQPSPRALASLAPGVPAISRVASTFLALRI